MFGAPAAVIEAARSKNNDFEVEPENWPTVEMFLRLSTQWVVGGMGSVLGLNYQSLDFLFKLYAVEDPKSMFEELRVMESGALNFMREKRAST